MKQVTALPPAPKVLKPRNPAAGSEARPVACRIEFHGEKASLGWYRGYPRSRNTWRRLGEISDEEEKMERTSAYEYFTLFKPGYWAVTLEMADGRELSVGSPDHPFTLRQFAAGPGKSLLTILSAARRRKRTR
jgi:hypothetical protein